jgi:hypothetical protein
MAGKENSKSKKQTLLNASQSARFIEAAKKTGADESRKAFEKAFKKVVKVEKPIAAATRDGLLSKK